MQKLTLITQYMTSPTEQKTVTIHILPNILRSKGNQAIEFSQFIKFCVRNIFFFQKSCKNDVAKLVPDLIFVFLEKMLSKVKSRS